MTGVLWLDGAAADNATKTKCDHGHEFTEANTYSGRGKRECRACHRVRQRAYLARSSSVAPAASDAQNGGLPDPVSRENAAPTELVATVLETAVNDAQGPVDRPETA